MSKLGFSKRTFFVFLLMSGAIWVVTFFAFNRVFDKYKISLAKQSLFQKTDGIPEKYRQREDFLALHTLFESVLREWKDLGPDFEIVDSKWKELPDESWTRSLNATFKNFAIENKLIEVRITRDGFFQIQKLPLEAKVMSTQLNKIFSELGSKEIKVLDVLAELLKIETHDVYAIKALGEVKRFFVVGEKIKHLQDKKVSLLVRDSSGEYKVMDYIFTYDFNAKKFQSIESILNKKVDFSTAQKFLNQEFVMSLKKGLRAPASLDE